MQIAVIDGQGGGIGSALIAKIRSEFGNELDILALGTNALATAAMLKAGANQGATGENAIRVNATKVAVIFGSLSIVISDALLGELTAVMANAIIESQAHKILLQPNRYNIHIAGCESQPLPYHIAAAIEQFKQLLGALQHV